MEIAAAFLSRNSQMEYKGLGRECFNDEVKKGHVKHNLFPTCRLHDASDITV